MGLKEELPRMYFTKLIQVLSILLVLVALVAASIFSFYQTEQSFRSMNDDKIIVLGFTLGAYMSIFFAMIAQYTQTVALFMKNHFCSNKVVFSSELPFIGKFSIKDNTLADFAFWTSALVDSLTNVVWFYKLPLPKDPILAVMLVVIGYGSSLALVWVEEAIGVVADSLATSLRQFSNLVKQEKRLRKMSDRGDSEFSSEVPVQNKRPPVSSSGSYKPPQQAYPKRD